MDMQAACVDAGSDPDVEQPPDVTRRSPALSCQSEKLSTKKHSTFQICFFVFFLASVLRSEFFTRHLQSCFSSGRMMS